MSMGAWAAMGRKQEQECVYCGRIAECPWSDDEGAYCDFCKEYEERKFGAA